MRKDDDDYPTLDDFIICGANWMEERNDEELDWQLLGDEVLAAHEQAIRAEAWDEGHASAMDAECGYINGDDDTNPYKEATR